MGVGVTEAVGVVFFIGVEVTVGCNVSAGSNVSVGVNAMVAVAVALGRDSGVSVVPKVAVTTRISGEGQLH